MVQKFTIFETRFNNEELENEFNNFFYKYNLTSLFTNEHRAGSISVTYIDAVSVINEGKEGVREAGSYHKTLKDFADYLSMANDNKSYEEAIFRIIYEARSFQGLVNSIKKYMSYIDSIIEDRKFNTWNIVWYNKDLK